MSTWFEFESSLSVDEDPDASEVLVTGGVVTVDALEGAKAIAREDEKTWGLLTADERDHYTRFAVEAIVAMGGSRI